MSGAEALAFAREHVSEESGRLGCYLGEDTWVWLAPKDRESLISAMPGEASREVKSLAVTALHELILPRVFQIHRGEQAAGETIEYLRDAEDGIASGRPGRRRLVDLRPCSRSPAHSRSRHGRRRDAS